MTDPSHPAGQKLGPLPQSLRKALSEHDLPFDEFMSLALYDPEWGYYSGPLGPVGMGGDFVTSPHISPLFGFAMARLATEFLSRTGDGSSAIVDIGSGDSRLLHDLLEALPSAVRERFVVFGVDRSLGRATPLPGVQYLESIDSLPWHLPLLIVSNELYDAFPFSRVVHRSQGLHELVVSMTEAGLDWKERPARPELVAYLADREIRLEPGQFADFTPEWERFHRRLASSLQRGMIVSIDYGADEQKLFSPAFRRFGTAGAFAGQEVSRDLLSTPGTRDLTAHINWSDLERAGSEEGAERLFRGRQAGFLISIGALEYPLLAPADDLPSHRSNARRDALRLVLPDGIGEEMSVLVQGKAIPSDGWSFQKKVGRAVAQKAAGGA